MGRACRLPKDRELFNRGESPFAWLFCCKSACGAGTAHGDRGRDKSNEAPREARGSSAGSGLFRSEEEDSGALTVTAEGDLV